MNYDQIRMIEICADPDTVYPRKGDDTLCYLKNVVINPDIEIGEYTIYHDFKQCLDFERKNVLYHYPDSDEKLKIGKFCSIGPGVKFIMNGANLKSSAFSTYPFPFLANHWGSGMRVCDAFDMSGNIVIGNDVWIGYEAVIMAGVTIGDGAVITARSVVSQDIAPYTIAGGIPAYPNKKRFDKSVIEILLQLKWWDWPLEKIRKNVHVLCNNDLADLWKLL